MRVLDLGCGRAMSSVFLQREFGVQVWATDLWFNPTENLHRVRDAGVADGVFPIHADARSLPFAANFFDAVISIDSYFYYGTDDMYLNDVARFLKPNGQIGIAMAGLVRELDGPVPDVLREWWSQDRPWFFHSAEWWQRHWERTGILTIDCADTMPDGWKRWLDWHRMIAPDNATEIRAVEEDRGQTLGYVRVVGRRNPAVGADGPGFVGSDDLYETALATNRFLKLDFLFPAQHEVDGPAATDVTGSRSTMSQQARVGPAGLFEGVGEDWQAIVGPVAVDRRCE